MSLHIFPFDFYENDQTNPILNNSVKTKKKFVYLIKLDRYKKKHQDLELEVIRLSLKQHSWNVICKIFNHIVMQAH